MTLALGGIQLLGPDFYWDGATTSDLVKSQSDIEVRQRRDPVSYGFKFVSDRVPHVMGTAGHRMEPDNPYLDSEPPCA